MSSVDIIVPCYRYAHFLRQSVESVLSQPITPLRILIIDDASPDNTAEIASELASKDPRITFVRHTKNIGHIRTYNEGLDWASSDYVLLLSADDYLLPDALRHSTALLDAHPDMAFTCGKAIGFIDDQDPHQVNPEFTVSSTTAPSRVVGGLDFITLTKSANIVETPTAVVRTSLLKRLGGYRPELPHSGDMEMWLRLAAHGSVGMIGHYQAVYRLHRENMSLQYYAHYKLPDLQQRKAALDCFFLTCGHVIPNVEHLHRRMFWLLGDSALGCASAAFNDGDQVANEHLIKFALDVCPQIRRSWSWRKLWCKRIMGRGAWSAVHPVVTLGRQAYSRWRGLFAGPSS